MHFLGAKDILPRHVEVDQQTDTQGQQLIKGRAKDFCERLII